MDDVRCPQCAALVAPGAAWCSLCYHDLRPPAPEAVPVAAEPAPVHAAVAALPAPPVTPLDVAGDAGGRRRRHARVEPAPPSAAAPATAPAPGDLPGLDTSAEAAAEQLLAALRVESALSPGLRGALARIDSPGAKVGVMIGGFLLVALLLFAFMAVVGSFL